MPPEVATVLQRTARGALANVVEHATASSAAVTLAYQQDCVSLDVRDDGRGFEPTSVSSALADGEGTALAASIPLPDDR